MYSLREFQASELQSKIENAGGEKLRNQKAKVDKIQSVSVPHVAFMF